MHDLTLSYGQFGPQFLLALLPLIIALVLWSVIIKGFALWHAARGSQKGWFIVLLLINTLGILEIIYLVFFRPTAPNAPAHHSPVRE
jgi:methionyl-tRNA synthetase